MRQDTYDLLSSLCIQAVQGTALETVVSVELMRELDVSWDAVLGIFLQHLQKHIKKATPVHRLHLHEYIRRYRSGEDIFEIARKVNFSPYLLARMILAKCYSETDRPISKQRLTALTRDPMKIDDARLRDQLVYCIENDRYNSPYLDRVRDVAGDEYEYVLYRKLKAKTIPFQTEDELRNLGLSKTPDIKLQVPLGVEGPDGEARVIFWIDSKAMFGNALSHEKNVGQLQGYVNRFGPGMVIYWFDFVESLNRDPDILICSDFPSKIISHSLDI